MPVLQLLRIPQWIKNLFVYLPAFFAGRLLDSPEGFLRITLAFLSFSLAASGIYIINDYLDREEDRLHPTKKNRPLAAGRVSLSLALFLVIGLLSLASGLAYVLNESFAFLLLGYIILNIAYSVRLKHIPILDVTLIATGFLLRIFAGGIVADVFISRWIILMTFLLALFLALAKRREDVLLFNSSGNKTRKSVDGYNLEFINISLGLMAAVTIVAYIMYTLSPDARQSIGNENIYLTTVFVILGMLRYLQITMVENKSGAPAKMLWQDRFLQFTLLGWMVTYYFFLYIEK